jgi:hypothetical protein
MNAKIRVIVTFVSLFTFLALATASAQEAKVETIEYEYKIVSGDTLGAIAKKYLGDVKLYQTLLDYNSVEDVNKIEPGVSIIIPIPKGRLKVAEVEQAIAAGKLVVPKPAAAIVKYVKGKVILFKAADRKKHKVLVGTRLFEQDSLATDDGSYVSFECEDGSVINVGSETKIKIKSLLRRKASGKTSYLFRLVTGRLHAFVSKLKTKDSKFAIGSLGSIAGVRGTEFRAKMPEGDVTQIEVLEDNVVLTAADTEVAIPENYGSKAKKGQKPMEPKPLPPAPDKLEQASDDDDEEFTFSWNKVDQAVEYVWTIATDEKLTNVFAVEETDDTEVEIDWDELPTGKYYWSITVLDADGFESRPSPSMTVTIVE